MTEILNKFKNIKKIYAEILKDELKNFDNDAENKILQLRKNISDKKSQYKCVKCGSCCKLAATTNSPDDLKTMADNGDNFAKEFVTYFKPYEDFDVIRDLYPDYFDTVDVTNEKLYFYHCDLVTEDNLCPKYEDRPQICKDFPENPIDILPVNCVYKKWQDDVLDDILRLKALTEILNLEKEGN